MSLTISEAGFGMLLIDEVVQANENSIRELTREKDELLQLIAMLHESNRKLLSAAPKVSTYIKGALQ